MKVYRPVKMFIGYFLTLGIIVVNLIAVFTADSYTDSTVLTSSEMTNWPVTLSIIDATFALMAIALLSITDAWYSCEKPTTRTPMKCATVFYALFLVSSIVSFASRGIETGMLTETGLCIRTEGDLVCPTVLYRSAEDYDIKTKDDCEFNNFADSPSTWNTGNITRINWADKEMYDKKNRGLIFRAYTEARGSVLITEEEMVLYHDCWNWGCDEICNDKHHDINRLLVWTTLVSIGAYAILVLMSACEPEETCEEQLYSAVATKVEMSQTELEPIPVVVPVEPEPADPVVESEETKPDSSSSLPDSSGSSSSRSWNFNLRM